MDFNLPGYTITIDADGLSKLALGGTVLGQGITQLQDASWYYRPFDSTNRYPNIVSKTVSYQSNGAIVTHLYNGVMNAEVVYTYTISGNDVHINAKVTNTGTKEIQPGFTSMSFLNGAGGYTIGLTYNQDNTKSDGEKLSYPSIRVPFGAVVMSGPSTVGPPINLASWSEEDPNEKYMGLLFGRSPFPGAAIGSIFLSRVPPGGSRVYKWAFRFQNSTDWQVLLSGYKSALRAVFPTIGYEPDARPLAFFSAIDVTHVRPDNPYGYNDGGLGVANCVPGKLCRRFDTLVGCQNYVSQLVGPMVQTGYQGIVMWQPQGIHPRGFQYRPDFNVFPPETIPNLPTLTSGFNSAGLKIGLLARPKTVITSSTWTTDGSVRIGDHEESMLDLKSRLQWALTNNFNGFYLDSFIADGPDHNILKMIRDTVGPDVHTFCEASTALSMAISGSYEEITWDSGLVLTQKQQVLRWLYPEGIIAARFKGSLPPGGYAELYPAMFDLKLTPWIEDHRVQSIASGSENAILQPLVASHIGPNKRWI